MSAVLSMTDALSELSAQTRSDPDAQATVTDFLDYTEYLPSDLIRSLTLIRKLDETYISSSSTVHDLTETYGSLPSLPADTRPEPQHLRTQVSRHLHNALNARESSYAEASRLYDVVDRHFNRLTSIISKLQALPQPPSRDPSPIAQPISSPQSQRRGGRNETAPAPRITLRLDGARPSGPGRPDASATRYKGRHRRVTVPGEVLPPPNPDSPPPSSESDWESLPGSPVPMATSRVGAPSRPNNVQPSRIKITKQPKLPKLKLAKPPRVRRPAGSMGTNVHSSVAGISTSNALALLTKPPEDAVPGSEDAPWLKLTPYEMAKLRKRMKKNAVWNPSETMIRRELADLGRGPENYHAAKATSDATGRPFIDHANIAETARLPGKKVLAEGEISAESLGMEEIQLSNRGMKLNEAKKLKKENMQKEMAAQAAAEAEQAARRLADSGSALKAIFARPRDGYDENVIVSPTMTPDKSRDQRMGQKRKRDSTPDAVLKFGDNGLPESAKDKKRKRDSISAVPTSTTTKVPLAAPGISKPPTTSTPTPVEKKASALANATTDSSRRPSIVAKGVSTEPQSSRRGSRVTITPADTPTTAGKDRARRASTISLKLSEPALPVRGAARRAKRPAPGPVKEGIAGGTAVSVGTRKAPPRKAGGKKVKSDAQEGGRAELDDEGMPIDPNEPTYCLCGDVSFGTMIACENNDVGPSLTISSETIANATTVQCEREWFHLECVGLTEPPGRTAKWYCPDCRKALGVGEKGQASARKKK